MSRMAVIGATLALVVAGEGGAQRVVQPGPGANYPPPAPSVRYPPLPQPPVRRPADGRRGGATDGRWWGGVDAPGGWNAYRPPQRGWTLPRYWVAPRFHVDDWNSYGFPSPPQGYYWTRYYDDAVLIDGRGEVFDTIAGVDWEGRGAVDAYDDEGYREPLPPPREERVERRYHEPGRAPVLAPPAPWVSGDGRTTVTVTTSAAPPVVYAPPAPYGYAGAGTTVTVQGAPVVTTTTTEIIEDSVTYTRPVVRRVHHKRVWRPRPKPRCVCGR